MGQKQHHYCFAPFKPCNRPSCHWDNRPTVAAFLTSRSCTQWCAIDAEKKTNALFPQIPTLLFPQHRSYWLTRICEQSAQ